MTCLVLTFGPKRMEVFALFLRRSAHTPTLKYAEQAGESVPFRVYALKTGNTVAHRTQRQRWRNHTQPLQPLKRTVCVHKPFPVTASPMRVCRMRFASAQCPHGGHPSVTRDFTPAFPPVIIKQAGSGQICSQRKRTHLCASRRAARARARCRNRFRRVPAVPGKGVVVCRAPSPWGVSHTHTHTQTHTHTHTHTHAAPCADIVWKDKDLERFFFLPQEGLEHFKKQLAADVQPNQPNTEVLIPQKGGKQRHTEASADLS